MSYYRITMQHISDNIHRCKNMGLLLDKYLPEGVAGDNEKKGNWLREVVAIDHNDHELTKNVYDRWFDMAKAAGAQPFNQVLDWRMVVGLGGETVLETDLTLHHLYGIPFIPGSALKGLTRAYVTTEGKKEYYSTEIDKDHEDIKRIFGSQEQTGTVVFFDAMPSKGEAKFELDIMNPHYPDYYGKGSPPTNDQKPKPITFLTVADTTFTFALAPRNPKNLDDVQQAKSWLQEALQKYGIGGKTSAGYGYFKTGPIYERPNLPNYSVGDEIRGVVIDEKTDTTAAKYIQSGKASKCLKYLPFDTDRVLILIDAKYEEARQWRVRNYAKCQFIEERVEDNCTLLICEPGKKSK